jgi:hypothetical protein
LLVAAEARALGRGGPGVVEEATGVARSTINRGMKELETGVSEVHRQRRKGGGRKKNRASPLRRDEESRQGQDRADRLRRRHGAEPRDELHPTAPDRRLRRFGGARLDRPVRKPAQSLGAASPHLPESHPAPKRWTARGVFTAGLDALSPQPPVTHIIISPRRTSRRMLRRYGLARG